MTDEVIRARDGRRLRSTQEWLNAQGDDEVAKFRLFDDSTKVVIEGWKNTRTKARFLTKARPPTSLEEEEFKRKKIRETIIKTVR